MTQPVAASPRTVDPPVRRWLTLAVVSVSLLVVGLDTTVLNVALPTLVGELGAATGVAVMGSLLSDRYRSGLDDLSAPVPENLLESAKESVGTALALAERIPGEAGTSFADAARRAFVDGMGPAVFAGAGVTAAGILLAFVLTPSRNADATGIPPQKDSS
ncbi:hypothetical protein ABZ519_25845 [Streptomyces collinus]|uniref:hypothetical protein n=1 Tax=Streptomyces collinus TaxID=42684 RepID=UPI0033C19D23